MTITGKTQLLGLLGYPVSHSFSPLMHNAALAAARLEYVYLPLSVAPEHLQAAIAGLSAIGFRGVNVTIPHKQTVMTYLDELSAAAQAIGAVNTIVFHEHRMRGHNTDWSGFLADLDALGVMVVGRTCIVLGAGGSARAIVYALLKRGADVHIYARRRVAADAIAAAFSNWFDAVVHTYALDALSVVATEDTVIINTTPLGMSPNVGDSIWPANRPIAASAFVYDLVYNPPQTRLMQQAQRHGARSAAGLGMLLQQGAHAFKLWTEVEPDLDVMAATLPFVDAASA